jgi:hypothetical protein
VLNKFLWAAAAVGVMALAPAEPAAQITPQTTGRGAAPKRPAPAPRPISIRVSVRDQDGASLSGVRLVVSGASTGDFMTGAAGTAIVPDVKDGTYRVRCEREGFITLEREFTIKGGVWNPIDIVLNAAPAPPAPPQKPAPPPPPVAPARPGGPAVTMSIPDFIDRNFVGRDPIKESILACAPLETVRLLQMREGVARHVHERIDEVIYVVAGEGVMRINDQTTTLKPGSLVVVPNGSQHAFERQGKNPLIVVSTLIGSACESPKPTP